MKYIKSERSNNEMDTTKLESFCKKYNLEILPIKESIMRALKKRHSTIIRTPY